MNCAEQLAIVQESLKTLTKAWPNRMPKRKLFRRKDSDLQLRMEALGLRVGRARTKQARAAFARSGQRFAAGAEGKRSVSRSDAAAERGECVTENVAEEPMRRRGWMWKRSCAARMSWSRGRRSGAGSKRSRLDGRKRDQREGRVVVGRWQCRREQGVKIGMPLRVVREDRRIASCAWSTSARRFAGR